MADNCGCKVLDSRNFVRDEPGAVYSEPLYGVRCQAAREIIYGAIYGGWRGNIALTERARGLYRGWMTFSAATDFNVSADATFLDFSLAASVFSRALRDLGFTANAPELAILWSRCRVTIEASDAALDGESVAANAANLYLKVTPSGQPPRNQDLFQAIELFGNRGIAVADSNAAVYRRHVARGHLDDRVPPDAVYLRQVGTGNFGLALAQAGVALPSAARVVAQLYGVAVQSKGIDPFPPQICDRVSARELAADRLWADVMAAPPPPGMSSIVPVGG